MGAKHDTGRLESGPDAPFAQDQVRRDPAADDQPANRFLPFVPHLFERKDDLVLYLLERSERERPRDLSLARFSHLGWWFGFKEPGQCGSEAGVGEGESASERLRERRRCGREVCAAFRVGTWTGAASESVRERKAFERGARRTGSERPRDFQIPRDLVDRCADTFVVGRREDGEGRDGTGEEEEGVASGEEEREEGELGRRRVGDGRCCQERREGVCLLWATMPV